jgi:membrane-associated phospholipid phosphatase
MRRPSPLNYFSLHYIIGLALSFFFILVFCEITESLISGDMFVAFDQWVARQMLYLRTTYVTSFMKTITDLGGIIIIAPCSVLASAYLFKKRLYGASTGLAVAVIGGVILNNLLKMLFQRPRPLSESTLIAISGWSFPSGHAMNSIIFYGMIAYLLARGFPSWGLRVVVVTAALSVSFIVGLSRIYLQVHYASDVMAGFAGGLFWLCVCITGIEMNIKEERDIYDARS